MAKRNKGRLPSSGEIAEQVIVQEVQTSEFSVEDIDMVMYDTKATPKLRVVLVAAHKDQVEDAIVIKQLLRRDRIRCSIYYLGAEELEGVILASEELLSEAIKSSCCILSLDNDSFKFIALRSWLAGRLTASWITHEEPSEYLNSKFNTRVVRIAQIPALVRRMKSLYTKELSTEVKRHAFTYMELI